MKRGVLIILALLMGGIASLHAPALSQGATIWKKPILDVIYEPTSYPIVEKMLDMAGVTSQDVVYDLGCGDGRIVIMAAKHRGSRGVGIDLDPERIHESVKNAEREGVADKVVFYEKDLFAAEIKDATVVMIYLFPEVNLRLRPKLLRELKPGTRIVSHSHTMAEWQADSSRTIHGHDLHFFVVPANVTGTWKGVDPEGREISIELKQKFQRVKGTMSVGAEKPCPIRNCSLEGEKITFTVERTVDGVKRLLFFQGQVTGDTLEATIVHEGGNYSGDRWKGTRVPRTSVSIAE